MVRAMLLSAAAADGDDDEEEEEEGGRRGLRRIRMVMVIKNNMLQIIMFMTRYFILSPHFETTITMMKRYDGDGGHQ